MHPPGSVDGAPFDGAGPAPAPCRAAGCSQAQWLWSDRGVWKPYSASVSAKLEAGRQIGKTTVDVDKERYVDLTLMYQCRHDDVQRRRKVRRDVDVAPRKGVAVSSAPYMQFADQCSAATCSLTDRLGRPRRSEPAEQASPFMWHWQQAAENGASAKWQPYSARDSLQLEYELRQGQNPLVGVDHGYVVDLTAMLETRCQATDACQYNTNTPDRRRPVRRALWYREHQGTWEPVEPEQSIELERQETQGVSDLQHPQHWRSGVARGWVEVCECRQDASTLMQFVASGCGEVGVAALALLSLDRMQWDARAWRTVFADQVAKKNFSGSKSLRVLVMRTTLTALRNRYYIGSSGQKIQLSLEQMLRPAVDTTRYKSQTIPPIRRAELSVAHTSVSVESIDCVEAGFRMQDQQMNPVVLNMANARQPGGGYLSGAGAQEENLCRRSAYCLALEAPEPLYELIRQRRDDHYPLGGEDGIYTPNVMMLRGSEDAGYEWLPRPRCLSFVAVAAIVRRGDRPPRLTPAERTLTAAKIRTILRIAHYHGHDALVLSAFGCGAFGNPPADVAAAFREVLGEREFHGAFRKIVFAILDDHNTGKAHNPDGNFQPFLRQFPS